MSKNLAITTLCTELIIAGGIASKILPFFEQSFVEFFIQHENTQMRKILESITVSVITDYNISLYGAANALTY